MNHKMAGKDFMEVFTGFILRCVQVMYCLNESENLVASIWKGLPDGSAVKKNLPAVQKALQDSQVQSLCGEDPLQKGMASCFSILAFKIP